MGALEITNGTVFESKSITPIKDNVDIKETKDLITERYIQSLNKNQNKLVLKKGTVITPLAKDKARELGIDIEIK